MEANRDQFSDCHYLATLMRALTEAIAARPPPRAQVFDDFDHDDGGDDEHFHTTCLEEIDRYRRMDEWIPSYHNILSTTALDCTRILIHSSVVPNRPADFLQYTAEGTSDHLRLSAFSNLLALGLAKNPAILRWFLFVLGNDPSPYIREHLIRILGRTLGAIAIGEHTEAAKSQESQVDSLIIEQEASTTARAAYLARKQTVLGALNALKDELSLNQTLKTELWNAITSTTISLHQMGELLEICDLLYTPETTMVLAFKYPRYWSCRHLSRGKLLFTANGRIRTTPMAKPRPLLAAPATQPSLMGIKKEHGGQMAPPKLIFKPKKPVVPTQGTGSVSPGAAGSSGGSREGSVEGGSRPKLKLMFGKSKIGGGQGSPTP